MKKTDNSDSNDKHENNKHIFNEVINFGKTETT